LGKADLKVGVYDRFVMGLLSLLGATFYYHPLITATLIGVMITSIGVIKTLRSRP
jgi:hypothetical protein